MTDLEICKKLKAVGFPQGGDGVSWCLKCGRADDDEKWGCKCSFPSNTRYEPTLQELLDYLGERFYLMLRSGDTFAAQADSGARMSIGSTAWQALALLVIEVSND